MTTNDTTTHTAVGKPFILGGDAIFTIAGRENRFTFKVTRKDPDPGSRFQNPAYFVKVLTGSNNKTDYQYLGVLDPTTGLTRPTKASRIALDAPSFKALNWTLSNVWQSVKLPPSLKLYHEGFCGRCGDLLTVPESIACGFGPTCSEIVGVERPKVSPSLKRARTVEPVTVSPAGQSLSELLAGAPAGFNLTEFLKVELPAAA